MLVMVLGTFVCIHLLDVQVVGRLGHVFQKFCICAMWRSSNCVSLMSVVVTAKMWLLSLDSVGGMFTLLFWVYFY